VVSSFVVENSIIVELLRDDDNSAFFGAILHTDEGCTSPTVVVNNASTEDTRSIKVNDIIIIVMTITNPRQPTTIRTDDE
jgi:hypothetical protein